MKLSYEEKKDLYQELFSLGNFSSELNDKLVLISLIALVSSKLKAKNPKLSTLDIILKIAEQEKDDSYFYHYLEGLAIVTDDFSYATSKYDSCGLSSSEEIIKKIKNLLNAWLPF
jgi:hypothetical protein